jgi:YfiH family protein
MGPSSSNGGLEFIEPAWPIGGKITAVTTTRAGGCSSGSYSSLNIGDHVGDDEDSVAANRARLESELGLDCPPVWLNQTHSTRVIDPGDNLQDLVADGSVTGEDKVVCAVMTADCLPLFLAGVDGRRVGVLHVGWRGLAHGIVEAGLREMKMPAGQVMAWSGPAIGPEQFEVGENVRKQLGGSSTYYKISGRPEHYLADLYGLVDERLRQAGIAYHGWHPYCTYRDEETFFSYRRNGVTGRMASLIWRDS